MEVRRSPRPRSLWPVAGLAVLGLLSAGGMRGQGQAERCVGLAERYMDTGVPDSAMRWIDRGLLAVDREQDTRALYFLLTYRAELLYYDGLFDEGMTDALRSLELAKDLGDSLLIAHGYNMAGVLFENVNNGRDALPYLRNALAWYPRSTETAEHSVSKPYQVHGNLGQSYFTLGLTDSARHHLEASLADAEAKGSARGITIAKWALGRVDLADGRTADALAHFTSSLEQALADTVHDMVVENRAELARTYRLLGDRNAAMATLRDGEAYLREYPGRAAQVSEREFYRKATAELKALDLSAEALRMQGAWYELDSAIHAGNTRSAVRMLKAFDATNQRLEVERIRNEQYAVQLAQEKRIRALLIALGLLITAAVVGYAITYAAKRRQQQRLAELEVQRMQQDRLIAELRLREQVGRDMHDDLGAGLSALKLRSEMALRVEQDPAKRDQLSSLARTAGELIGNMRQIIWAMNADQRSLEDLVVYTGNYARTYLDENGLAFELDDRSAWPPVQLTSDQRRNVFLVVKEALHNIVKHAQARSVVLELRFREGLEISITDDGKGFSSGTDKPGNGLRNMAKRAEAVGGTFTAGPCEYGRSGTCVLLRVPMPSTEGSIAARATTAPTSQA